MESIELLKYISMNTVLCQKYILFYTSSLHYIIKVQFKSLFQRSLDLLGYVQSNLNLPHAHHHCDLWLIFYLNILNLPFSTMSYWSWSQSLLKVLVLTFCFKCECMILSLKLKAHCPTVWHCFVIVLQFILNLNELKSCHEDSDNSAFISIINLGHGVHVYTLRTETRALTKTQTHDYSRLLFRLV